MEPAGAQRRSLRAGASEKEVRQERVARGSAGLGPGTWGGKGFPEVIPKEQSADRSIPGGRQTAQGAPNCISRGDKPTESDGPSRARNTVRVPPL